MSQNKAKVDYAQVNQQSGFNIGKTSEINVEENTHLAGGVINAEGDKANHRMKTSTLSTAEIETGKISPTFDKEKLEVQNLLLLKFSKKP